MSGALIMQIGIMCLIVSTDASTLRSHIPCFKPGTLRWGADWSGSWSGVSVDFTQYVFVTLNS